MEKQEKPTRNCFIAGAISSQFIGESIGKHQSKTTIGAHQLFLGQVRADEIEGKEVVGIEYSAFEEMANQVFEEIRETTFSKFELVCLHIYHSIGLVKAGEICLLVFVSAKHRDVTYKALTYIVEEIKEKAPIYGKELFADDSFAWKVNS